MSNPLPPQIQEDVRKFENARFGLLLIAILAFVHLFFMFTIYQPILYTAPSIMWMSYLWVSESMGDVLAILLAVMYVVLYASSGKKRDLMPVAFGVFGFDVLAFYGYAFFYYGAEAFTEGYFYYGLLAFLPPVFLIVSLFKGVKAWQALKGVSAAQYSTYLDQMDAQPSRSGQGRVRPRRFGYRGARGNYRGYSGYGGTGSSGGGYRGSSGGYGGGGFGG